jgi:hypothetical protein
MGCCGGRRQQLSAEHPVRHAHIPGATAGRVVFEYLGTASTVVRGAATGRGYSFVGYGARVAIDARDEASVARAPQLRKVLR